MPEPSKPGYRMSLRTLLIVVPVLGATLVILGRMLRHNPEIFLVVLTITSTIVPFILAIATIIWIGAKQQRRAVWLWGITLLLMPGLGMGTYFILNQNGGSSPNGLGLLPIRREDSPGQILLAGRGDFSDRLTTSEHASIMPSRKIALYHHPAYEYIKTRAS